MDDKYKVEFQTTALQFLAQNYKTSFDALLKAYSYFRNYEKKEALYYLIRLDEYLELLPALNLQFRQALKEKDFRKIKSISNKLFRITLSVQNEFETLNAFFTKERIKSAESILKLEKENKDFIPF